MQGWEDVEDGIDYATQPWDFQIFIGDGGKVIFEDSDGVLETIGIMLDTSEMFPEISTRVTYPTGWYKSTVDNGNFQVLGGAAAVAGQIMVACGLEIGIALEIAGGLVALAGLVVYYTKDVYTRSLSPCVAEYYTKYSFY